MAGNNPCGSLAQFRPINRAVKRALRASEPVISVDTKKKELIGNYQNQGRYWRKTGTADKVNGHDFPGPEVPRAYHYGIYDLGRNAGFVNVGTDHDTGAMAVAAMAGAGGCGNGSCSAWPTRRG